MEPREAAETGEALPSDRPIVELGWVVVGALDEADREAIAAATGEVRRILERALPGLAWRFPRVDREETASRGREQPVELLELGADERASRGWDFALVVTGRDLAAYARPFALAAPSRTLDTAVLSTARLDPRAQGDLVPRAERVRRLGERIAALALHLIGHLAGLGHDDRPDDPMHPVVEVEDLDGRRGFDGPAIATMGRELAEVADERLEERPDARRARAGFFLRAVWHNAGDIAEAVREARPWEFPMRLGRLTTAAVSAAVVLLITAEAWDLGMSQGPVRLGALSALSLLGTTAYTLHRQGLLRRRGPGGPSEQAAVARAAVTLTVLAGLATTWVALFALASALALGLFPESLAASWAASVDGSPDIGDYARFASFVAAVGLVIGALGASFEDQIYFRHVAFVDEET